MPRNINFVRERRKTISRQEVDDKKILGWVVRGLIALGVVVLAVVGTRFYFSYSIQALQVEQKEVQQAIVEKEEVEEKFTVFAHKLKIVTELFGKRREKQDALKYFSNLFDSNVLITQLSYKAGDEILSFVIQSNSIFTLDTVFTIMGSDDVKSRYPDIQKDSLRRQQDGSYGMQVTLYFGDKPAALPTAEDGTTIEGDGTEAPAEGDPASAETAPTEEVPAQETGT